MLSRADISLCEDLAKHAAWEAKETIKRIAATAPNQEILGPMITCMALEVLVEATVMQYEGMKAGIENIKAEAK